VNFNINTFRFRKPKIWNLSINGRTPPVLIKKNVYSLPEFSSHNTWPWFTISSHLIYLCLVFIITNFHTLIHLSRYFWRWESVNSRNVDICKCASALLNIFLKLVRAVVSLLYALIIHHYSSTKEFITWILIFLPRKT